MATFEVQSARELIALIEKHAKARQKKVVNAIKRAARVASASNASALKRNIPVAHGELREAVHVEGMQIIVDAPHAAAVNNGSRPHWVPLEPLIAWVKLRGTQGILTERQQSRLPGTTTRAAAGGIAAMLRAHEQGGVTSVDAPTAVARAIQLAIAAHGTKPTHFVEKSLPEIFRVLDQEIRKAIAGEVEGGGSEPPTSGGGAKSSSSSSASGFYRKHADTYRGARIQTDTQGRRFANLKNGKRVYLQH